jgi:hypothetical protein
LTSFADSAVAKRSTSSRYPASTRKRWTSESFAPVRTLSRRDLETLRLLTMHQGRRVPTVGGWLLFGKNRQRDFPDAWIEAGRFAGQDKSRIVDQVENPGLLPFGLTMKVYTAALPTGNPAAHRAPGVGGLPTRSCGLCRRRLQIVSTLTSMIPQVDGRSEG